MKQTNKPLKPATNPLPAANCFFYMKAPLWGLSLVHFLVYANMYPPDASKQQQPKTEHVVVVKVSCKQIAGYAHFMEITFLRRGRGGCEREEAGKLLPSDEAGKWKIK